MLAIIITSDGGQSVGLSTQLITGYLQEAKFQGGHCVSRVKWLHGFGVIWYSLHLSLSLSPLTIRPSFLSLTLYSFISSSPTLLHPFTSSSPPLLYPFTSSSPTPSPFHFIFLPLLHPSTSSFHFIRVNLCKSHCNSTYHS